MAFTLASYDNLQTYVSQMAGGSSDTAFPTAIQLAIKLAETQMDLLLRVEEMIVRATDTVDEIWESVPTDPRFLDLRAAFLVDRNGKDFPLKRTSPERIAWYDQFNNSPIAIALEGLQYRIAPRSSADSYQVRLHYYSTVPDLSADSPCTAILTRYPTLYLYGTLANLGDWLAGDERLPMWEAKFQAQIAAANAATARRARVHTGP